MDLNKLVDDIVGLLQLNEGKEYDTILNDNLGGISTMINLGRDRTAVEKCKIAEYSAILDKKTCPLCKYLDGQVFKVGSSEYERYMPRIHDRCRCIYVYVGEEEGNQPKESFREPPPEIIKEHGQLIGKPNAPASETASLKNIIAPIVMTSMILQPSEIKDLKATSTYDSFEQELQQIKMRRTYSTATDATTIKELKNVLVKTFSNKRPQMLQDYLIELCKYLGISISEVIVKNNWA